MSSPSTAPAPDAAVLANATEALYRAALGPGDTAHYLRVFAHFDERGLGAASWNHAAAWLNLNWLLYRRLWRVAAVYALLLGLALAGWWWTRGSLGAWSPGVHGGLLALIGVLAVAVPGCWGSAWLHSAVRTRMTDAVRRARTVQEACGFLRRAGPARWVWLLSLLAQAALVYAVLPVGAGKAPAAGHRALVPAVAVPETPALRAAEPAAAAALPVPVQAGSVPEPVMPVPAPAPEPVARPAAKAASDAEAPRPRWQGHGINVGIFGEPANAQRAVARLRQRGLPVQTDGVESSRGTLTRVRVGPFERREQAEAAAIAVRELGLEAKVFGP